MSQINQSPIWQALNQHKKDIEPISLREMFKSDAARFDQFHIQFNDLLLDYSKHLISKETINNEAEELSGNDLKFSNVKTYLHIIAVMLKILSKVHEME